MDLSQILSIISKVLFSNLFIPCLPIQDLFLEIIKLCLLELFISLSLSFMSFIFCMGTSHLLCVIYLNFGLTQHIHTHIQFDICYTLSAEILLVMLCPSQSIPLGGTWYWFIALFMWTLITFHQISPLKSIIFPL